jgi:hypothetical protein
MLYNYGMFVIVRLYPIPIYFSRQAVFVLGPLEDQLTCQWESSSMLLGEEGG